MENKTKKCSECLADIPHQAKKCSHCGSKQKGIYGFGHVVLTFFVFGFVWVIISGAISSEPTNSNPNYSTKSDGYKLAFLDSNNLQYAEANQNRYNQLLSSIEQNCILDEGQTISDMLYTAQNIIEKDTGKKFKLEAIGTMANEIIPQSNDKIRCIALFAGISTLIDNNY